MLLSIGNRVRFIHTGTTGKIVDRLDDGLFIVALEDGLEIPASSEHLTRLDRRQSSVKASILPGKTPPARPPAPAPKVQYANLKSEGVQMAFEHSRDGSMQRYRVFILNITPYQVLYDLNILVKGQSIKRENGTVQPNSPLAISEMPAAYLSDNPTIAMNCRQISTEGMTDWLKKEFRLKPKQFFKKEKTAPLLMRKAHLYPLFEPYEIKEQVESLADYTQKQIRSQPQALKQTNYRRWSGADVKKFAEFPLEKDLHIEKLVRNASGISAGEILRKQLAAFETYLNDAIRLGVEKVFVIHGKGKGKLKDEIANRLINHPDVRTFKNEYHPKYGTGATEIFLH